MMIAQLCKDESGATAIEYALMAGLISLSVIAGATTMGANVNSFFEYLVGVFEDLN